MSSTRSTELRPSSSSVVRDDRSARPAYFETSSVNLSDPPAARGGAAPRRPPPATAPGEDVPPLGRDDHFLLAAPDEQLAVWCDLADVARVEPPVLEGACRF